MNSNGPAKPVRVSRANLELAKLPWVRPKSFLGSRKTAEIEGLLTLPVGYEAGKKYPFILNIHGGPAGVFTENFIGRLAVYPIATFAARGYGFCVPIREDRAATASSSGLRIWAIGVERIMRMIWPASIA
jgi:dipeptidyl aminopeptidase/acylaminoacyl peptidase